MVKTIQPIDRHHLWKGFRRGFAIGVTAAALVGVYSAAQATAFVYTELQAGDPTRNNLPATTDVIGSPPLPPGGLQVGDSLTISGTLADIAGGATDSSGECSILVACEAGGDWFQFTWGENAPFEVSIGSSHTVATALGYSFFEAGNEFAMASQRITSPFPLRPIAIFGPGIAGSTYLVKIWGTAGGTIGNVDYTFRVRAIPEPSVYALLIAGLALAWYYFDIRRRA